MDFETRQYKLQLMSVLAPALAFTIKRGDLEKTNELLKIGADVNERGPLNSHSEHFTPLYWACIKGHVDMVRFLLKKGADTNVKNNYGTALYWACKHGNTEIARILIEDGTKLNFPKGSALLPLSGACENDDSYLVDFLLKKGAKANARDHRHAFSPLHFARSAEISRLLLTAGAEINAKNEQGSAPIHTAAYNGYQEVVEFLVKSGVNPDLPGNIGSTALQYASMKGHVGITEFLLESGADVNLANNTNQTCLDLATNNGLSITATGIPIIPILLNAGAQVAEERLAKIFELIVSDIHHANANKELLLTWFQENRPDLYFSKFCTMPQGPGM